MIYRPKLICALFLASSSWAAVTVTNPSAGTLSGIINLTASVTSLPSAAEVDYILNDYHTLGTVQRTQDSTWAYLNWNTGEISDGPNWIKAVVKDISGNVLATSAEVSVTTNNFGATFTWNSPVVTLPTISLSGTITFDWATTYTGLGIGTNSECNVDGLQVVSANFAMTGGTAQSFDTRVLQNGLHVFSCNQLYALGGDTRDQMILANGSFVGNVQNGSVLMAVYPNISDLVMTVGQTFQLSAQLYFTDGSITTPAPSQFTYSQKNACMIVDPAFTNNPFPCASQSSIFPTQNADGPNYVTISSSGLITAVQKGHTIGIITDSVSGKTAYVNIAVRQYQTVPHLSSSGATLHAYNPATSIFRISESNMPGTQTNGTMEVFNGQTLATDYIKAGFNAFEQQATACTQVDTPCSFGSATQSTWQTNFNTFVLPQISALYSSLPGMCLVGKGDTSFAPDGSLNNSDHGANWATWSPDPLTYEVGQLKASGNICGLEMRDEGTAGFQNFNPQASMAVSDGTISKIVAKGGACTVYNAGNSWFGGQTRWGGPVSVSNSGGSTSGLAGTHYTTHEFCSTWNIFYHGNCPISGFSYGVASATAANPPVLAWTGQYLGLTPSSPPLTGTILIVGATGSWATLINGVQTITQVDATHFSVNGVNAAGAGPLTGSVVFAPVTANLPGLWITGGTNANPPVLTYSGGGFTTSGGTIQFSCTDASSDCFGAGGWAALGSGNQTVTIIDSTHMSVNGLNSTTWGALPTTGSLITFSPVSLQPTSTFDMQCVGVSDGTYNNLSSTDPNLVISVMAPPFGDASTTINYVAPGDPNYRNSAFKNIASRLAALTVPNAWPGLGAADDVTHVNWEQVPAMGSYLSFFRGGSESGEGTYSYPWGWGFMWGRLEHDFEMWGVHPTNFQLPDNWYHNAQGYGYVFKPQDVPVSFSNLNTTLYLYTPGGRTRTISAMNGSVLTVTAGHNLKPPGPNPWNWHPATISGNSDSAMNANWRLGNILSPTTVEVYANVQGKVGCNISGSPASVTVTIRGKTYSGTVNGGGQIMFDVTLSTNAPQDLAPGEHITVSGLSAPNTCGNDTYAFFNWQTFPPNYNVPTFAAFANSTGTGGTLTISDNEGYPNALYDGIRNLSRPNFSQPDAIYGATSGLISAYRWFGWSVSTPIPPNSCVGICSVGAGEPYSTIQLPLQRNWWSNAQAMTFIKRVTPFILQTIEPSPIIGTPAFYNNLNRTSPPINAFYNIGSWTPCHWQNSTAYGNALTCVNFSEMPQTITVPHSTYQISTNPISIYRIAYPKMNTLLLTGTQTSASYTLDPGESISFLYHSGATSFVQNVPIGFNLAGVPSATQVAIRYSYAYAGPLKETSTQIVCSASPCLVPLDLRLADVLYQLVYLDTNGVPLATSDPILFPRFS